MRALFLDAGPLVAHILCTLKPSNVGQHRRVETYTQKMIDKMLHIIEGADRHVSLPNVLTEASNHLGSGDQQATPGAAAALAYYISGLDEIYQQSTNVIKYKEYESLGLADTAIFSLATRFRQERVTVVTQDHNLYSRLYSEGVECVNVMHWRTPDRE